MRGHAFARLLRHRLAQIKLGAARLPQVLQLGHELGGGVHLWALEDRVEIGKLLPGQWHGAHPVPRICDMQCPQELLEPALRDGRGKRALQLGAALF